MRFLRNRFVAKFLAVLFLLLIVESTMHATVSYALTTGPHQPEYTSYEEPGSTDMVNLLTGDFSFSLPILDVPGPEGGFSVPLTYNAGIGTEQEASWVGLGWTLNVGAITRSIVQYPDDASGEVQSVTKKDLIGVRGFQSNALIFGTVGWNTAQGWYGELSFLDIITLSKNEKGTTVGVVGVLFGPDGVDVDAYKVTMGVLSIASLGVGGAAQGATSAATKAAIGIGISLVSLGLTLSRNAPSSQTDGYWQYSKNSSKSGLPLMRTEQYHYYLDQTRYEEMLGVLYLDKAKVKTIPANVPPVAGQITPSAIGIEVNGVVRSTTDQFEKTGNSQGNASDVSYNVPAGLKYKDARGPVILATDNYSVKAPGISGSIKPYRFDIGSVSTPREMSEYHTRLAPIRHQSYKVPFVYEGLSSNSYYYHVGAATSVTNPDFYFGLTSSVGNSDPSINNSLSYILNDITFDSQIRQDVVATKKLPMANHTEWLTNEEIKNTAANFISTGFMDYFSGTDRSQFREAFTFGSSKILYSSSNNFTDGKITIESKYLANFIVGQPASLSLTVYEPNYDWAIGTGTKTTYPLFPNVTNVVDGGLSGQSYIVVDPTSFLSIVTGPKYCEMQITIASQKRPNSIGGYSITGIDGITYHFALPSYEHSNYTKIEDKNNPSAKFSEVKRDEPFANTWLLTGITGSDFVDRNLNGVIDATDWGYWVKFNYGKYLDSYQWRIPFLENESIRDPSDTYNTISHGKRQIYYLNSIETRSHVALFIKDNRSDNRSVNSMGSLRLSEIDLLRQEDYQKLFLPTAQGGYGIPTDNGLANLGKYWMMSDFFSPTGSNHPAQGNFIIQNALKRVKFTHTYDLCPSTPNSNASNGGKLTLTRVALLGRNDFKIVPDYKFEYGNNPSYGSTRWDGWGMYNSQGTSAYDSHRASNSDMEGAAWSLTRVISPLGSTIDVAYERDDYSSISGLPIPLSGSLTSSISCSTCNNYSGIGTLPLTNTNYGLSSGDVVRVTGTASYTCVGGAQGGYSFVEDRIVSASTPTSITLSQNTGSNNSACPTSGTYSGVVYLCTVQKVFPLKKGGNIRVSSLVLNDQSKQYKTRYLYKKDDGTSSGVVAQEPEYIKTQDFDFYNLPGYPFTPVMYSKVAVLTGKLATDADYHTKQVYNFETPYESMLVSTSNVQDKVITFKNITIGTWPLTIDLYYHCDLKTIRNELSDYTSKIGKIKSIEQYDKSNALISASSMLYTNPTNPIVNRNPSTNLIENNYQGVFSEGTLMFDRLVETQKTNFAGIEYIKDYYDFHKMNRTTILKYPTQLQKVINSKDGFTAETENKAWDFISSLVVEKTEKSPLGLRSRTVTKPAFRVSEYSQMGSKAVDINNKNMLGHEAATYTYQTDALGNTIGLLSASVQTWKSDWNNYRYLNGNIGNNIYADGTEGSPNVWRRHQNYVYKGTYTDLRADGSLNFTPSREFNFVVGAANLGWQKTSEITRYDHYSVALEGKDLNNIFSSSKKDINAQQVYANASNANYLEFAYSGAEDWNASINGFSSVYLGGEVAKRNGTPVYKSATGSETHTGQIAVQLNAGGKTFTYKPTSLTNNRVYRVSAWTNSLSGAIYYSLNNGLEQTALPVSTQQVGNWYQINAEIPVGTFSSLEVGVKSTSGTVSFDDFRFQPRDGSLTANVYDPVTSAVTFVLDNQNMFTQYEYNDRGQLVKTYSESFLYGVKLVSENKINYKRFNTNQ
jgi:hypothetical protein